MAALFVDSSRADFATIGQPTFTSITTSTIIAAINIDADMIVA